MFKKGLAFLLAAAAVTTVSITSSGMAADGQMVEEKCTEVPCAHGWKYGRDLMQDNTLIGCHGYDENEGYTALYETGIVEYGGLPLACNSVYSKRVLYAAEDGEEKYQVSCVHGWKYGTDLMQGDTLVGCHGYDENEGYTALYEEDDNAVMPCYQPCECGGKLSVSTVWTGHWRFHEEVDCPDYPYGTDVIEKMNGISTYTCLSCGLDFDQNVSKSRIRCGGYR